MMMLMDPDGGGQTFTKTSRFFGSSLSLSPPQTNYTHTHTYITVNIHGIVVYLMLCRAPDLFRIDIITRTSWMLSHHSTDR